VTYLKVKRKEFIALHLAVLDDVEFRSLPQSALLLLIQVWLLRGRLGTNVPYDMEYLSGALGRCDEADLQWIISDGWLIETDEKHPPKSKKISKQKKHEVYGDYSPEFEEWWTVYPKHTAKGDAWKAWLQMADHRPPSKELIPKTKAYASSMKGSNPKWIKLPAGWLRDRRWEDGCDKMRKPKETKINDIIDKEQIDHYAHPKWKFYVSAVVAGEIKPGFEVYLAGL
jgi:hypothetical protein